MTKKNYFNLILLVLLFTIQNGWAQNTVVYGTVLDEETSDPIAFATVLFDESNSITTTDEKGKFKLSTSKGYTRINILNYGYKPHSVQIKTGVEQVITVKLTPEVIQLQELEVKGRERYRNKGNPAVELIKKVIDHKPQNKKDNLDYYEYEQYEKLQFALSNISEKFQNRRAFRNFQFVFENMDTTTIEGKSILPLYFNESLSEVRYRKNPESKVELKKANKSVAFEGYVDNKGLEAYTKNLYQNINIYDNNITLLTNQFISPTSPLSPTFYMFFIADTIKVDSAKFIKLDFLPRNNSDFLFQGYILIALDSSYAITKVDMGVNKKINLNWVKELNITQEFEKTESGYFLSKDQLSADFGLFTGGMGIYGQRSTSYKDIVLNKPRPEADYKKPSYSDKQTDSINNRSDAYWQENRHEELSKSEKNTYVVIDSVKSIPAFKRSMDVMVLLFAGYKTITPYFELGPVSTFYSFNPVEGFRLRAGGRTTNAFSKKIVFEGYGAYGFKDEKWKFFGGATYSLSKRSIYEFPVKTIRASYQRDTKIPGQELQFIQEDNFLLSFKRGNNDKWLYNDIFNLEYTNEFENHFSFVLGYKNWIQRAAGGVHFDKVYYLDGSLDQAGIQTSEFALKLRWAPNEKFYQGKTYRIPISYKNPIFTLRYAQGINGFLDGKYTYSNVFLNIYKRFYLSQLGYTDIAAEGGKIFGTIPYPLLDIHRANQTYSYQLQSYNLMNFLEFVSDEYVSLNVDHFFNGFIFNKIPLLKKLKWREAISVKILYGNLSTANNPQNHLDLLRLPVNKNNEPITYSLSREPYIEGSVAIANIFKLFRVDLVKRFTYLDHDGISTIGIRGRFKFDF